MRINLSGNLLLAVVVVAACTPTTTAPPSGSAGGRAVASVRVSSSTPVVNLDPKVGADAASSQAIVLSGGLLYRYNPGGVAQPDLAKDASVSPDGKQVTVHLKSGLSYSDGTALKASDAVAAAKRQLSGGSYASFLGPVTDVTAPDDTTVVFSLSAAYPDFVAALAERAVVLHPADKVNADKDYFTHPVSAGPYQVLSWKPGDQSIVLQENPKYVGGPLAVQKIEMVAVPDPTSRILQLTTGRLDWAFDLPLANKADLPSNVTQSLAPISGTYLVVFNTTKTGAIADPRVRQAISLGIDRARVRDVAFFGVSPVSASWFSGCSSEPLCEPALPNSGGRDIAAAKALLAQTPYASGFTFTLQSASDRPGWKEAAVVIAESLKDIGATVSVTTYEQAARVANEVSGNFDASFTGSTGTPLQLAQSTFGKGAALAVRARYSNPTVLSLITAASSELDTAKRKAIFTQMQTALFNDMVMVPVADRVVLVGSRLAQPDPLGVVKNNIYLWVAPLAR